MTKGYHIWLIAALGFTLLWGLITATVGRNFSRQRELALSNDIALVSTKTNSVLKTYELFSNYIFSEVVDQPEVLQLIAQASSADEAEKSSLRTDLYRTLEDKYEEMVNYNFRQLHFHLPMGESFLRFHSPQNYGDNLYDVRESVRIVNDEQRFVKGFEEGKVYNGYRFVYPIFHNEGFIGSVEVSVSMTTVINTLASLYPNVDSYFIIKKSIVDSLVFDEKLENYETSFFSQDYYFDKEVHAQSASSNKLLSEADIRSILDHKLDDFQNLLPQGKSFSFIKKYHETYYQITFFSIENISNLHTGYLVSVSTNESLRLINQAGTIISVLFVLIYVIFQTSLFLFMRDQIRIKKLAEHDSLTNLFNRQKFEKIAETEVARNLRYKHDLCLFIMDIDFFKKVNDQYGHATGDQILIKMSRLVADHLRKSDTFARWGGEEFIGLLPETGLENGIIVAEKIKNLIADYDFGLKNNVTVSIGIASLNRHGQSLTQLIDVADIALYKAKNSGRNQVCCADQQSADQNS